MRFSHLPIAVATYMLALTAGSVRSQNLEEVFVSASRVAESGADLPLAWSAIRGEEILITAPVHISELMQRVPGAWVSRGNGQESLVALRSPVLTGAGACGAFFMAWDGISLRGPGFCNVNQLFDANAEQAGRVEVIRGPGTAVYGSDAMHGVINSLTAAPTKDRLQRLTLEAGPNDYLRGRYAFSDTAGTHGISLRMNAAHDGGYQASSGYHQQKATLRHDYSGAEWIVTSAIEATNLDQDTAGYIQGFNAYKDNELRDDNPNPEAYRESSSLRAYSRWQRNFGERQRLTVTPYVRRSRMEFLQHFLPWQAVEKNGHDSFGMRLYLDGNSDAIDWTYGLDLDMTDGRLFEYQENDFSPNQPRGVHYDYEVAARLAAIYSQTNWRPFDRWELQGGARLEYRNYDYDNQTGDGSACAPAASNCRFFRPSDREDDFTDLSLHVGASYQLAPDQVLYARASRGFRAPQTAELYRLQQGQRVAELDAEEIDSIELGLRGSAREWSWDIALYTMRKNNVIFQDSDRQNVSGASTDHSGLEFSLDYRSLDNWYAGIDANFARHKYSDNPPLLGTSTDIDGNDIDTAPRVFGSARIGYLLPRGGAAELEWVHMGEYYLEPENAHEYAGHDLLNLRFYGQLAEQWRAGVRVTNLLDEDYAERADFGFGQYRYFVGQPMGLYVELTWTP